MKPPFVYEEFEAATIDAASYDALLERGWRHFGTKFYRYSISIHENELCAVVPLRIRLANFRESTSQRRVLRRNADLTVSVRPAELDEENTALFARHATRFTENVPDSFEYVLGSHPPREVLELQARLEGRLLAASYIGMGKTSISSIYGIHDPTERRRSLGVFTLLSEIALARAQRKTFHYLGYCYNTPSPYDYKKAFHGLEMCDWADEWRPLPRSAPIVCAATAYLLRVAEEAPVEPPPRGPENFGNELCG